MMKTYQNHAMTDAEARPALADACKQVETNLPLYTYQCQNHSSVNDIYPGCANNQWTCGFWPGEIWLAYEATGDEKFKTAALIQVDSFADRIARKVEVDHHDMGFLYSPTCVAAWKLVGSETGKNAHGKIDVMIGIEIAEAFADVLHTKQFFQSSHSPFAEVCPRPSEAASR